MSAPRIAMDYILGFGMFSFLLWLLGGIIAYFKPVSETGTVYDLANYLWYALPVIFIIFSIFWFLRKLKEWEYVR